MEKKPLWGKYASNWISVYSLYLGKETFFRVFPRNLSHAFFEIVDHSFWTVFQIFSLFCRPNQTRISQAININPNYVLDLTQFICHIFTERSISNTIFALWDFLNCFFPVFLFIFCMVFIFFSIVNYYLLLIVTFNCMIFLIFAKKNHSILSEKYKRK